MTPPTTHSSTASMRNCSRMSRCRAPSALRSPISRVRSRTLTSMMLETPTPPTSKRDGGDRGEHQGEQAEDPADGAEDLGLGDRRELLALVRSCSAATSRGCSASTLSAVGALTASASIRSTPNSRCAAVTGMCTSASRSTPNVDPTFSKTPMTRNRTPAIGDLPAERVDVAEDPSRPRVSPSTATRRRVSTSDAVMYSPRASGRSNTLGTLSLTPLTVTNASRRPTPTVSPDATDTATRSTVADHAPEQLDVVEGQPAHRRCRAELELARHHDDDVRPQALDLLARPPAWRRRRAPPGSRPPPRR